MTHKLILNSHREKLRLRSARNIVKAPIKGRKPIGIHISRRKLSGRVGWTIEPNTAMDVLVAIVGVGEVYEEPLVQKLVPRTYLKGMHNLWA
jgi:hypothetical protein